jgi:hypothetical protein
MKTDGCTPGAIPGMVVVGVVGMGVVGVVDVVDAAIIAA